MEEQVVYRGSKAISLEALNGPIHFQDVPSDVSSVPRVTSLTLSHLEDAVREHP